jgi:hypothetical protein
MDAFTLPAIQPVAAPISAANAIDRAGARFKQAADDVAGVLGEIEKAEVVAQTQEATLQTTKGLNDALHLAKSEPYVTPERVKELFGGQVPDGIDLTEPVPGQADDAVRQARAVVPMHEIIGDVFERQSAAVVETAARNVKAPGWQKRFRDAAAVDVERARAEALDWQRAQRLADVEIRTTSQLQQAEASRNWALYETILDTPENHLNVKLRETLKANYPRLRTKAAIDDRLRGAETPEEIDSLLADIAGNRTPTEQDPDAPFMTKLTPEEQYQHTVTARARKGEIINDMLAAAKRQKEEYFQGVADAVEQEIAARAQGRSTGFNIAAVDGSKMDFDKFMDLKRALEAKPDRVTNNEVYYRISNMPKDVLRNANLLQYADDLDQEDWEEVVGWQRAARKDDGAGPKQQGPVPGWLRDEGERWVSGVLELDPKKNPAQQREFNEAMGRLLKAVAPLYRKDPDRDWTYNDIAPVAVQLFHDHKKVRQSARAVLVTALESSGANATDAALAAAEKQIKTDAPLVDKAFRRYHGDDKPTDEFRALVHGELLSDLDHIREQLVAQKMNPDDRGNQIHRAVQNLARLESAEYAAQVEQDEVKERSRTEANTKSEKMNAEADAKRAVEAKAEQARRTKMPDWERQAEVMEKRALAASDAQERERARARFGSGASMGSFRIGPPVSTADVQALREVERTREERHGAIRIQMERDRAAYREFTENVKAGDSVAKHLFETLYLDNFEKYVKLRREGKVF